MAKLDVIDVLRKHNFRCNTSHLQQFFITDDSVIDKIVDSAEIIPKETVLEIGIGVGNLTCKLAEKARRVIGIEIDKRYLPILNETLGNYSNVGIIYKDALRIKWPRFDCLIASIPFTIVEPVILRLVKLHFRTAVLVLGDRSRQSIIGFALNPIFSNISKLSALTHAYFKVEEVGIVEKEQFYPIPRTDATIIKLTYKSQKEKMSPFLRICRKIFSSPTMIVGHIIRDDSGFEDYKRRNWENIDVKKVIQPVRSLPDKIFNKRADVLSNSDFAELFKFYAKKDKD